MTRRANKMVGSRRDSAAFVMVAAIAWAWGLHVNQATATTGGWAVSTTGDWDGVDNIPNYGFIDGNGAAYYNDSPTNSFGPANGYTSAAAGESSYWINSPHGYTTSGTDPANGQPVNFTTVPGIFMIGWYSTAPALDTARGPGTFYMQGGAFTVGGAVQLGEYHGASPSGSEPGYLYVQGGTLAANGVAYGALSGGGALYLGGGVLNVGQSGSNNSISADIPIFQFSGGTIQNLTTATVTSFGTAGVCAGSVSNLTGQLTLNCANSGTFTGNITGSGAGNVVNSGSGMITFAPSGGTMDLIGLQTSAANTAFQFDALSPASCDLIDIGSGGLDVDDSIVDIGFSTAPVVGGDYELVGNIGAATLGDFDLMSASGLPAGSHLSTTASPGNLDLVVAAPEPSGLALLVAGALLSGLLRRRPRTTRGSV